MHTSDTTQSESAIVRKILQIHSAGHPVGHHTHNVERAAATTAETATLSQREKEVLALLVKGYINKEIADKLNISLTTVIFHRNNISEKLKTRSLGRLTIYAVLNNIVSLSEI
jgi:FixJ family two-component response regulator